MEHREDPDLRSLMPILEKLRGEGRAQLLPAMLEAQKLFGHLGEDVTGVIARELGVPSTEVYGVLEFYSMLYDRPTGRTVIRVCTGPACVQRGSREVLKSVCEHLGVEPGQVTPDGEFMVEAFPCLGLCDHAPAGLVGDRPVAHLNPKSPQNWIGSSAEAPLGIVGGEPRWLSGRCGEIDPTDLKAFEDNGGFAGLRRALLAMDPADVVAEIKASGLVGRGGAAFPTGLKWEMVAAAKSDVHYVVANGDESEPGTFKDRVLMEGDPFFVLEGMTIAAYASKAQKGYLYVRGEYPRAQQILQAAIESARDAGYLGRNILGSEFSFDVEIRSGAGAYICGEETALFDSIEGKRGHPRIKPPYPTTHGVFGRPTLINNIETLCAGAWIIANGPEAYRSVGTDQSPGAKLFCLSGDVERPGIYEAAFGVTLGEIIDLAGGVRGKLKAVLLGGAAGAFAGPRQLTLPMSFEGLREAGLPLGSGVVEVLNHEANLREALLSLAQFFAHESCGKCLPCQLGTQRQLEIMEKVVARTVTEAELIELKDVGFTMTNASLCGLGMTAATAILSALEKWPGEFLAGR